MTPKETFEAAAKKYSGLSYDRNDYEEIYYHQQGCTKYDAFIEGAKWQAERMYSEEDLIHLLNFVSKEYSITSIGGWFQAHESIEDIPSIEVLGKWFEQFKK